MPHKFENFITYRGPSMNPIFVNLDVLTVVPYKERKIQCGDVIVFHSPEEDKKVTHRIISVSQGAIRTRGDNNLKPDSWTLNEKEIIGRVVYAQRGKKRIVIHGGLRGRITAELLRAFVFLLRPLYQRLSSAGIFSRLLPLRSKIKIISIKRPAGVESQLIWGKIMIGRRKPGVDKWIIHRPFRLFLKESDLP